MTDRMTGQDENRYGKKIQTVFQIRCGRTENLSSQYLSGGNAVQRCNTAGTRNERTQGTV